MFENLSKRLIQSFKKIRDYGRLTKKNIDNTLNEIKISLLDSDVSILVVKSLISSIKKKAIGKKFEKSFTPGQELVKLFFNKLVKIIDSKKNNLNIFSKKVSIILICGLQGSGKTTSVIKLSNFIKNNKKKKILVVSTDIYRPAAIKQLEILSKKINVNFFPSHKTQNPIDIIKKSILFSKKNFYDILIIDTAGRLHLDKFMMEELSNIHKISKPNETLLVVDGMTGQDAIKSSKIFNKFINLTGIILTKMDGDTKGGAALSIKYEINKPIKFISYGEDAYSLEVFNSKKIVKRILNMENTLSLIDSIKKDIRKKKINLMYSKNNKKEKFSIIEFVNQLKQIKNTKNVDKFFKKIYNSNISNKQSNFSIFDKKIFINAEYIVNSMTIEERNNPSIIKGSRKRRIALGSGLQVRDINIFIKKFEEAQKVMKQIKKIGIFKIMKNIKNIIPFNFNKK